MKTRLLATAAAVAGALFACPVAAAPNLVGGGHFGGGEHFTGGAHMGGGAHFGGGGHFGAGPHAAGAGPSGPSFSGTRFSGTRSSGTWSGGLDGHHWRHHEPDADDFFFFDPFRGWGDPFWGWGGPGFVAGYDMVPYWDSYDDYGYGSAPPSVAAAPPGYDCDGWRWEPSQQRYVPAKVACQ